MRSVMDRIMRGVVAACPSVRVAAWGAAWLVGTVASGQDLSRSIEAIIDDAQIGEARVGVSVVDVESGATLAALSAETPAIPASNQKLLTTGTALAVLGPGFVFRTELRAEGDRLVVVGSGDPALGDPALLEFTDPPMTVEDLLARLAEAVGKEFPGGVREIVVDDRVFDRELIHPLWEADDLNKHYAPQVCGLNFHANVLAVFTSPSPEGVGRPPRVTIQPSAPWVTMTNKARTVAKGSNTPWLTREASSNAFTLFGEVRSARVYPDRIPAHDNALFTGQLLAERLMRRGVAVGGETALRGGAPRGVRLAGADDALAEGRLIAVVTTPLSEVLDRCNADSINLYAEALLKRVGHEVTREPGSWTNGAAVVRMVMQERIGSAASAGTTIRDGSGLARENRVSPRTLTSWIASMAEDPELGEAFVASLAAPGSGTFSQRFKDVRLSCDVRGKSGAITGVRALSGLVTSRTTGRRVAFSILVNDANGAHGPNATRMSDHIVDAIDDWLARTESGAARHGG